MAKTSHKISISAPKSRVFNATKNGLKGWYTPHIEGDVTQGETVVFKFSGEDPFHWQFVELISPTVVKWHQRRRRSHQVLQYVMGAFDGSAARIFGNRQRAAGF
jgi:hypothetical protein